MEDCGMDFVIGESDDLKVDLCFEKKNGAQRADLSVEIQ